MFKWRGCLDVPMLICDLIIYHIVRGTWRFKPSIAVSIFWRAWELIPSGPYLHASIIYFEID